jgi:hypothetical protein
MSVEKKDQSEVRAEFYGRPSVSKHILTYGVPRSDRAFMDMVVSGTAQKMDDKEGRELMASLHQVVFRVHSQQINIMDKSNGKTIASIRR